MMVAPKVPVINTQAVLRHCQTLSIMSARLLVSELSLTRVDRVVKCSRAESNQTFGQLI